MSGYRSYSDDRDRSVYAGVSTIHPLLFDFPGFLPSFPHTFDNHVHCHASLTPQPVDRQRAYQAPPSLTYQPQTPAPLAYGSTLTPTRSTYAPRSVAEQSDALSKATSSFDKLKLTSFYVRPGYGSAGKEITVLSNYFQVRVKGGGVGKIIQCVCPSSTSS